MKLLGIDISSNRSGWAVLDYSGDDNLSLLEHGLIQPTGDMEVTQRLFFFGNEILKIINKFHPDEIVIEEIIIVHNNPLTMRTMASFRGVAIYQAYSYQKRLVTTYVPPEWKKAIGLNGLCEKAVVQLLICKTFGLIPEAKLLAYEKEKDELVELSKDCGVPKAQKKIDIDKVNAILEQRIRDNIPHEFSVETSMGTVEVPSMELTLKGTIKVADVNRTGKIIEKRYKKLASVNEKELDKRWLKLSTDIYSDSGINNDLADAIGVAIAFVRKNNNAKE